MSKKDKKARKEPIDFWLKRIFENGTTGKAYKIVNILRGSNECDIAIKRIISWIADRYGQINGVRRQQGIVAIVEAILGCSFELGDCTLINNIYSVEGKLGYLDLDRVRLAMLDSFYRFIGSSLERTKEFCRVVFEGYQKELAEVMPDGKQAVQSYFENRSIPLVTIVRNSVFLPALNQYPQKQWLNNLIEAHNSGDKEASDWLEGIMAMLMIASEQLALSRQSDLEKDLSQRRRTINSYVESGFYPAQPRIVLPDKHRKILWDLLAEINKQALQIKREVIRSGKWLRANVGTLLDKRNEIINQLRRGIRKNGCDWVDVSRLSALQGIGIESIAFYPTGEVWPNMDVVIVTRRMGCLRCEFRGLLRNHVLSISDKLYEPCQAEGRKLNHLLLEYVITDILYRITVCADTESVSRDKATHPANKKREDVSIAWHWHTLPVGHQASEETIRRSVKDTGFRPPPGQTYNEGHEGDDDNSGPCQSPPRLVLTDEKFMQQ